MSSKQIAPEAVARLHKRFDPQTADSIVATINRFLQGGFIKADAIEVIGRLGRMDDEAAVALLLDATGKGDAKTIELSFAPRGTADIRRRVARVEASLSSGGSQREFIEDIKRRAIRAGGPITTK
jgi:hypothetical protein